MYFRQPVKPKQQQINRENDRTYLLKYPSIVTLSKRL